MKQAQCFVSDLVRAVELFAPVRLAESWDNVGLIAGRPSSVVRRVMTCLEVTPPTLREAVEQKADAMIAHHPLIFKPLTSVNLDQPVGALLAELLQHKIALIAAHTNLDASGWGTNSVLAEACGYKSEAPLFTREAEPVFKFVVFVPQGHEQAVIEAIARGGGGRIGAYTHCSFRTAGIGTFMGEEGAHPFIGEAGRFEQSDEFRLESVVPENARAAVIREVLAVHPYEEVAFDFYALAPMKQCIGLGCLATLPSPTNAGQLAQELKDRLKLPQVRLSGSPEKKVKRVGFCSGSGGSYIGKAAMRCDAFITGEINYHQAVEAHARGLAVIELGHFESEALVAAPLAERLAQNPKLSQAGVEVFSARQDLQPFKYLS